MTPRRRTLVAALAAFLTVTSVDAASSDGRSFYMGFTPIAYDATAQALEETYAFIQKRADLIAHHLAEGVPWPEAYDQKGLSSGRGANPQIPDTRARAEAEGLSRPFADDSPGRGTRGILG